MAMKQTPKGSGANLAVKLGKHTKVKAGPAYKTPARSEMSKDMYADRKAESQT